MVQGVVRGVVRGTAAAARWWWRRARTRGRVLWTRFCALMSTPKEGREGREGREGKGRGLGMASVNGATLRNRTKGAQCRYEISKGPLGSLATRFTRAVGPLLPSLPPSFPLRLPAHTCPGTDPLHRSKSFLACLPPVCFSFSLYPCSCWGMMGVSLLSPYITIYILPYIYYPHYYKKNHPTPPLFLILPIYVCVCVCMYVCVYEACDA